MEFMKEFAYYTRIDKILKNISNNFVGQDDFWHQKITFYRKSYEGAKPFGHLGVSRACLGCILRIVLDRGISQPGVHNLQANKYIYQE